LYREVTGIYALGFSETLAAAPAQAVESCVIVRGLIQTRRARFQGAFADLTLKLKLTSIVADGALGGSGSNSMRYPACRAS
jgi:hypothetical protein